MTDNKSKAKFQHLASSGLEAAKSQLLLKLDEIMNTEVSLGVIDSLRSAVDWMKGTLYYEQLRQSTNLFDQEPEDHLKDLCHSTIQRLREIGVLEVSSRDFSIRPLPASRIMVSEITWKRTTCCVLRSNASPIHSDRVKTWLSIKPCR